MEYRRRRLPGSRNGKLEGGLARQGSVYQYCVSILEMKARCSEISPLIVELGFWGQRYSVLCWCSKRVWMDDGDLAGRVNSKFH